MIFQKPHIHLLGLALMCSCVFSCSFENKNAIARSTHEVSSLRNEIVEHARDAVGSGYKYGATGANRFDCSGLVYSLYTAQKIQLPRSTSDMAHYGEKISKEDLRPGDLIFFRNVRKIDHVAIVSRRSSAKTWLIHSTTSRGVVEEVLEESPYWSTRIDQCRKFIP